MLSGFLSSFFMATSRYFGKQNAIFPAEWKEGACAIGNPVNAAPGSLLVLQTQMVDLNAKVQSLEDCVMDLIAEGDCDKEQRNLGSVIRNSNASDAKTSKAHCLSE